MGHGPFSGREIVKVMVNSGIYEWDRTNGDHAILRWEPPEEHDSDARTVPVPLHDEVDMGDVAEHRRAGRCERFRRILCVDRAQ